MHGGTPINFQKNCMRWQVVCLQSHKTKIQIRSTAGEEKRYINSAMNGVTKHKRQISDYMF